MGLRYNYKIHCRDTVWEIPSEDTVCRFSLKLRVEERGRRFWYTTQMQIGVELHGRATVECRVISPELVSERKFVKSIPPHRFQCHSGTHGSCPRD